MIKKSFNILICILLIGIISLTGCVMDTTLQNDDEISIVCCGFSEYDWVRNITANVDNINLILLPRNGVELHSFQPTPKDALDIKTADIIIYSGGESSKSIENIVNGNDGCSAVLIDCTDIIGDNIVYENHIHTDDCNHSEIYETHDHNHESDADENSEHSEIDEHLWLSLRNASLICDYIKSELMTIDENNKDTYSENADEYISQLNMLDVKYSQILKNSSKNEVVFADRFPFIYLLNDYDICYTAAFPGCSTEINSSFKTIISLAEKIRSVNSDKIIVLENSTTSIASAVDEIVPFNLEILEMNSLQAVNEEQIKNGLSYLSVMEENLNILTQALN